MGAGEVDVEGGEWAFVGHPTEADLLEHWGAKAPDHDPLEVVFLDPAKHWTDAVPIGNGRLGAMVWGGVANEIIQLNHDTLWTGVPGNYTNPHAPAVLSRVRQLVDSGKYSEATTMAFDLSGNPSDVYQPLGDIHIDFGDKHNNYDLYERVLDLDTALAKLKYVAGDVEFTRQHFCSNPHQVFVMKISANKPASLSFMVSLDSKLHHHSSLNGGNQIIMKGSCPGRRIQPKALASENANPKGIQFAAVLDLHIGNDVGTIHVVDDKKLRVEGSNWAVLLLAAASSFDGPFTMPEDSKKDPVSESMNAITTARKMSFSQLYAYHLDDYQELFHRVTLNLSKSSNIEHIKENSSSPPCSSKAECCFNFQEADMFEFPDYTSARSSKDALVSTAERVRSFKDNEDPSLVGLLFQYGRYLLISCSRPGTQVANLQGIWNKDTEPAWDAAPHLNINLPMNYRPALSCNLSECHLPLLDFISSLAINGTKTAKINYEADGWVAHQVSDIWAKTSPDRGDPVWALWPMGGAWLCTHLWEHYIFSMDKDFLKNRAYPLLESCACFLLDWLIEGKGGFLETNPSTSPEHAFVSPDGKLASVSYSSTMDVAIIKEVFMDVLSAAEVLSTGTELVGRIKKALARLPPTRIARDGSIMEWAQDFQDPDVHHRHLSHLFGLFPGHTITLEKTPDLTRAADYSLYKRGDVGPGWSTAWKVALWAHLCNDQRAYELIKRMIILVDPDHEADFEGGLYSNLFTAHPPFQIDANFGFPAAIAEMLVQSTEGDLFLLPALPRNKWPNGCVKGLKARGDVTINICWKEGALHETSLWTRNGNPIKRVHYNGLITRIQLSSRNTYLFNKNLKCLKVQVRV